jgi:DNA-directed RNA polymerase subunit RPC12/RpoP
MTFKAAACPNCSAALRVSDEKNSVDCTYCGTHVIIREHSPLTIAPQPTTVIHQYAPPVARYTCPLCGSPHPPQILKRVSALGWVIFVFGLPFFIVGCLLGLLFKKEVRVCPSCKGTLPAKGVIAAPQMHPASTSSMRALASTGQAPSFFRRWPPWVYVVGALLLVAGVIGALTDQAKRQSTANQVATQPTSSPVAEKAKTATPAENLAEAKKALADNYQPSKDPMQTRWGRVADARSYLEAIPSDAKEYREGQKLLEEVKRREKAIEQNSQRIARTVVVDQMEKKMLSEGMDMTFTASGPDNTNLTIKYALMSRPLVYKLTNETDFLENMRKAGFKKVTFTDGYYESWKYDL